MQIIPSWLTFSWQYIWITCSVCYIITAWRQGIDATVANTLLFVQETLMALSSLLGKNFINAAHLEQAFQDVLKQTVTEATCFTKWPYKWEHFPLQSHFCVFLRTDFISTGHLRWITLGRNHLSGQKWHGQQFINPPLMGEYKKWQQMRTIACV